MERICEADGCGIDFSRLRALEKAASKMILVDYWIFVHEANADYKGYAMFALAQEGHCRPREVRILPLRSCRVQTPQVYCWSIWQLLLDWHY